MRATLHQSSAAMSPHHVLHAPCILLSVRSTPALELRGPLVAARHARRHTHSHRLHCCALHTATAPNALILADSALSSALYNLGLQSDAAVSSQLTGISPVTFLVVFGAGLLTSLSPCTLSVLPLTIGYIGGYNSGADGQTSGQSSSVARAASFAFGLATTLALLGIVSTYVGKAYGQIGSGLPIAVSLVAIVMGLNLLEVIQLRLPSLDVDVRALKAPPILQAYLAGLTFALAASPCSTPVLATLLAYVSTADDPVLGGGLLFAYTTGYVAPLLTAAALTGALSKLLLVRQYSAWVPTASGFLLLAGGTYTLLSRTVLS